MTETKNALDPDVSARPPVPAEHAAPGVSVVIPAFNEEGAVAESVAEVHAALAATGRDWELIIVDDGSSDATAERAAAAGASVLRLPENCGYGAALKAGIARARYATIVISDADGTYPHEMIPELLEKATGYDMVVGARQGPEVAVTTVRGPARWFLRKLAGYLAGRSIPDLNSGLRVMRKALVERHSHVLPAGFSFTTTITLAALCSDSLVRYEPIAYRARVGQSKIRPRHAFDFLLLILRTIVYFNPLKIFLPLGLILFLGGLAKFIYDVYIGNLSESAVMLLLGAGLIWALGLLSDQIARVGMRRGLP